MRFERKSFSVGVLLLWVGKLLCCCFKCSVFSCPELQFWKEEGRKVHLLGFSLKSYVPAKDLR